MLSGQPTLRRYDIICEKRSSAADRYHMHFVNLENDTDVTVSARVGALARTHKLLNDKRSAAFGLRVYISSIIILDRSPTATLVRYRNSR